MTDKSRRDWRWLALGAGAVLALTVVAILATIGLAAAFDVRFDALSRDPTSVYKGPVYAGWFSNLVTLLWQVPATCALLAAVVLRATRRAGAAMFLTAGLIGAVLAADDLFLIHESLAESARLPDLVLPILYGIAVVAFMIVFRGALGTAGIALVAVALLLWTASIGSVVATQQHGQILASALKLAGVGFWALLILRLAFVALRDLAGGAPEDDEEPEDDEPEDEEPPVEPPAPKPAKKKPAKKAAKKVEEPATVAVASAADLPEEDEEEGEPDDEEPQVEAPAPVPAAVAPAPVAAPVAAPEPALWPPAAEPVDPVTEMQRVVPPLPPRPDPQPEPVTQPMPVTRVPDDTRTVAQPIVRAAPRPPTDPGRGRQPQPPRRPVDPGPPPQRPGPPAPQQQPSGPQPMAPAPPPPAPQEQPPTGPEPAIPPAPPQPHPLASPAMPPAQPPPAARPDQDGPRHRRT